VLGVIEDVTRRTPSSFVAAGQRVVLLGETREELSGSEWAHVVHGHLGGRPPAVSLAGEKALAALLHEGVGLLTSAHDLSDGGLAQALVEASLPSMTGAAVSLAGVHEDPFVALFAESTGRVLVTVAEGDLGDLVDLAARHGVPLAQLGTTGGDSLAVEGLFDLALLEVRSAWMATLPAALG
jgi:phosphoribosylformylglycinamidine synthase